MSTPTQQRTARRPAQAKGKTRVTHYVDQQLEKTRRQVKSTDLIASILLLVVTVIGFLLLAAIVDAWVFTLTPLMRWAALLLLVSGCVVMMVFSIWPLLTKKINPDYAAKMLEDAKPGFRNSLLNYVWFRKQPEAIGGAVFDAVARQAAVDLNSVPDDSSVDRSKVIRLGFWLVGMTAAMIAYFILSPKNPLQTFNRVMFPSADLAKPAVVTIADVTPGNAMVFFGDQVEITAKIYGPHSPEQVQLIYSTNDGRQSGQVRIMQPDPTTPRQYKLNLTENTGGLRESLEYEIVARDGQSGKFEIKVAPRPAITIESIQIVPPKYTKLKPQTTLQGAIDGVEGARVTVNATANLEIDSATIELLTQLPTLPNEDQKFKPARSPKKMTVDSKNAKTTFQLQLDINREKPIATHYRLNFRSIDGESPAAPNIYPIRIIPDLAPELEVRSPVDAESKVPANGTLNVTALANDVDYEISFVKIHIEHRGNKVLSKKLLLKNQADNQRQAQARYVIRPEELSLAVGDQAIFYITAGDNRTAYFSDTEAEPNLTRSRNYSFTVVEPNKSKDGQQENSSDSKPPSKENKPADDSKDPKKDKTEPTDEGQSSENGDGGSQKKNDSGEGGESEDGGEQKDQSQSRDPSDENNPSDQPDESSTDEQDAKSKGSGDPQPSQQNNEKSEGDDGSESSTPDKSKGEGTQESEPEDGGTDGSEQEPNQESTDGSGGNETDTDGGDPGNKSQGTGTGEQSSDSSSDADASNARSGNNPSDDSTVNESAPETKDENLTEGEQELSKDASEAEKVRQAEKFFSENPDKQKQEGDPNQSGDQEDGNAPQDLDKEEGRDPSKNQEQAPNDSSANSEKQERDPSKSGNQTGSEPESKPQGAGNKQQDPSSQNPQNGNSKSDPPENNPSGNSAEQKPTNQNENNPSGEPDVSDKPESPEESPSESGKPNSGEQGDDSGTKPSGAETGEKQPSDSPSEKTESGDQPKSEGPPSESGKPSESPSGQGPEGQQPSSESGKPQDGPEGQPPESSSSGEPGKPGQSGQPGQPGKPGEPSNDAKPAESENSEGGEQAGKGDVGSDVLQREKENREHSKKSIDLLLDKLRSQRHNPDKKLLKQMGWDKQDLNDFVDSWDDMKAAAEQGDAKAKRKLERREQSLGLTPNDQRRTVAGNQQEAGDVIQDGVVNEAPPEQFHSFNLFLQDLQRARP